MSIFNELLPKLLEITNNCARNFNDELEAALGSLEKFEEEHLNSRKNAKHKAQRDKTLMTTLQSIDEDDNEINTNKQNKKVVEEDQTEKRVSKKRSKNEVEGMSSPEQEKRAKRNASVKAQSNISKQNEQEILKELDVEGIAFVSAQKAVNVNLNQKMRREDSTADKKSRRRKEDKENSEPILPIQIKQEKISLPPEPMDTGSLPVNIVKQEPANDENVMPPPNAPVPKPRKALQKEKKINKEDDSSASDNDEPLKGRRTTRTRKQTDTMPPPPPPPVRASTRAARASTRASSRATRLETGEPAVAPPEPRPKRTRGRKKLSESSSEPEKNTTRTLAGSVPASPADKPRPKRTRRGKNAEKEIEKPEEPQIAQQKDAALDQISPKEERITQTFSPVLQTKNKAEKKTGKSKAKTKDVDDSVQNVTSQTEPDRPKLDETKVLANDNNMDTTVVLPNGVYKHAPVTPQSIRANETVVLETHTQETIVIEKPHINDATVVLEKDVRPTNITDDNDSLITDDGSEAEQALTPHTPPHQPPPQPSSAVKEKVQKFEELAARTTRTRAQAKMQEDQDTHTPPDRTKPAISQETLHKMNNIIFNSKPPQVSSSSACKPRANLPAPKPAPASASKLSSLSRQREAAESEREDARKKKEAMLEAKREQQRKKREEKMANAAAAREAAERERKLAMEAAAKERMEKQAHADQGKLERLKEAERKKLELARKAAETEERRRAEETARRERLAIEQKKADTLRRKQLEEAEAVKKEAAAAKEIEKKQKEYLEKQKIKHKLEEKTNTPLKHNGLPPISPLYMADGFEYLNSDSEDENTKQRPVPAWSMPKARKLVQAHQSMVQQSLVDKLFSVRVHSPDLREIFPLIERARLKRTSSAVWRTPPRLPPVHE